VKFNKISFTMLFVTVCSYSQIKAHAGYFDGTPVQLTARHSGKCLDIRPPTTSSDTAVVQMSCNNSSAQKWKIVLVGSNQYQIVSSLNGRCFDVRGASQLNGGLIKQSTCTGKSNQLWTFNPISSDYYQISSVNSKKCLEIGNSSSSDNVQAQQMDCSASGASNQLWNLSSGLTPSAPLMINGQSNVVIKNVKIANRAGPCILIKGNSKNITIQNSELGPCLTDSANPNADLSNLGAGVFVTGSSYVTVDNVNVHDTDDSGITIFYGSNYTITNNKVKNAKSQAIKAQGLSTILIRGNTVDSSRSGVYVSKSSGAIVDKNKLNHIQGLPRANFVQFNNVTGPGNRISCNIGAQYPYGTAGSLDSIEDDISLYKSSGTSSSPILVVGNKVKGGGPSKTGSGIMLGDGGGSYIVARDNVVVSSGNLGMAISGGTNISIINNKIFSKTSPIVNDAIAVWNYHPSTVTCNNITVQGNRVNWTNKWGPALKVWENGSCSNQNFTGNTFSDSTVTESIFDTYISSECL